MGGQGMHGLDSLRVHSSTDPADIPARTWQRDLWDVVRRSPLVKERLTSPGREREPKALASWMYRKMSSYARLSVFLRQHSCAPHQCPAAQQRPGPKVTYKYCYHYN